MLCHAEQQVQGVLHAHEGADRCHAMSHQAECASGSSSRRACATRGPLDQHPSTPACSSCHRACTRLMHYRWCTMTSLDPMSCGQMARTAAQGSSLRA